MRTRSKSRLASEPDQPDQRQERELHEAGAHEADAREVSAQEAGPQEAGAEEAGAEEAGSEEAALEGANELSHFTGGSKRSKKHVRGHIKDTRYVYHCMLCQSCNTHSKISRHFNDVHPPEERWLDLSVVCTGASDCARCNSLPARGKLRVIS